MTKPTEKTESKPDINPGQQTQERKVREAESARHEERAKEINDGDAFIGEDPQAKRRLQERENRNEGKDVPRRNIVNDPTGHSDLPVDNGHEKGRNRFDPSADNYNP